MAPMPITFAKVPYQTISFPAYSQPFTYYPNIFETSYLPNQPACQKPPLIFRDDFMDNNFDCCMQPYSRSTTATSCGLYESINAIYYENGAMGRKEEVPEYVQRSKDIAFNCIDMYDNDMLHMNQ